MIFGEEGYGWKIPDESGPVRQRRPLPGGQHPEQAEMTAVMPIYNRPVQIVEALSIIMFHAGLHHWA